MQQIALAFLLIYASVLMPSYASEQPTWPLNDTGINWWATDESNFLPSEPDDYPNQDASLGRDVTDPDNQNGHLGFRLVKLDAEGEDLPSDATAWHCVRDEITGLVWEIKTAGNGELGDQGLHDADDRYLWYHTNSDGNGGFAGYAESHREDDQFYGGAICFGYRPGIESTFCNTDAFVARVNEEALCGYQDWRLPDLNELRSITELSRTDPAIDLDFFPNTQNQPFWTILTDVDEYQAWFIYFDIGYDSKDQKYYTHALRLVRGGQAAFAPLDIDADTAVSRWVEPYILAYELAGVLDVAIEQGLIPFSADAIRTSAAELSAYLQPLMTGESPVFDFDGDGSVSRWVEPYILAYELAGVLDAAIEQRLIPFSATATRTTADELSRYIATLLP